MEFAQLDTEEFNFCFLAYLKIRRLVLKLGVLYGSIYVVGLLAVDKIEFEHWGIYHTVRVELILHEEARIAQSDHV